MSLFGRWSTRVALAAVIAFGIVVYVESSSGTKQADLGTALISAGLIGVLVVLFDHSLRRIEQRTIEIEDLTGKAAAPVPATDPEAPIEAEPVAVAAAPPVSAPHAHPYVVRYAGRHPDETRIDAEQTRLRVFRADGSYFQFFTAIMSGIAVRTALGMTPGLNPARYHRAIAEVAGDEIHRAIRAGRAPLENPTWAIETFPDPELVWRRAREITTDGEPEIGEIIISTLYA